jgi:hypothetical protein
MKEYPIHDLVIHAFELISSTNVKSETLSNYQSVMDWILEFQSDSYDETNLEQAFRSFMKVTYVDDRSRALKYLHEGITLNRKTIVTSELPVNRQ